MNINKGILLIGVIIILIFLLSGMINFTKDITNFARIPEGLKQQPLNFFMELIQKP